MHINLPEKNLGWQEGDILDILFISTGNRLIRRYSSPSAVYTSKNLEGKLARIDGVMGCICMRGWQQAYLKSSPSPDFL